MIYGITLIVLGVLAAPSLLLSRRPDAKELLDKVAPYQGWIGLIFCFWGLWATIRAFLHISILKYFPVWWLTWVGSSLLEAALGFVLGYGLINKLVLSNSEEAKEKGERLMAKLTPIQGKLGLAGIIVGSWVLISWLFFR